MGRRWRNKKGLAARSRTLSKSAAGQRLAQLRRRRCLMRITPAALFSRRVRGSTSEGKLKSGGRRWAGSVTSPWRLWSPLRRCTGQRRLSPSRGLFERRHWRATPYGAPAGFVCPSAVGGGRSRCPTGCREPDALLAMCGGGRSGAARPPIGGSRRPIGSNGDGTASFVTRRHAALFLTEVGPTFFYKSTAQSRRPGETVRARMYRRTVFCHSSPLSLGKGDARRARQTRKGSPMAQLAMAGEAPHSPLKLFQRVFPTV